MSRKLFVAAALAVCLALVFAAISASERTRTRSAKGIPGPSIRTEADNREIGDTFDPRFRRLVPVTELGALEPANVQALGAEPVYGDPIAKASAYMDVAATQSPDKAYATLQRVLDLGLESAGRGPASRILTQTYVQLAELIDGPQRQAYLLGRAAEFAGTPEQREELQARIVVLGGAPSVVQIGRNDLASNGAIVPRDFGTDDSCAGATPAGVPSITLMSIADPVGSPPEYYDQNFVEVVIPGPLGVSLEIETTSDFCNDAASCSTVDFDTDMNLYGMCDNGFPDMLVARDLNQGDGGLGWLSKIQTTCLLPGAYFLQVEGQFGAAPKNFNVEIREIGTCVVPVPDNYEPDDTTPQANSIGKPNSIPDNANGWGRANREIQDHSVFPPNENDNVKIDLTRTERVLMATQVQFENVVAGVGDIPSGPDEDTQALLYYGSDPHGGVCNKVPPSLANYCKSSADCDPNAAPWVPSLPANYCIPLWAITFGGESAPRFGRENPLAFNDDATPANLGSQLDMCLPRSAPNSPMLTQDTDGFVLRSRGYRPPFPGSVSDLAFDYQALARNQGPCLYEQEPNNAFGDATPVPTNTWVSGINELSETMPFADFDIWGPFDAAPPEEEVTLEVLPKLMHPAGDSEVALWVGPSDSGQFFLVADEEDETANVPNSTITLKLPPANDYLGNTMAQAGYYVVVYGLNVVPNWYYDMRIKTPLIETSEVEPNNSVPETVGYLGKTIVTAAIAATCDIDRFRFTVPVTQYLDMYTSHPSTDTTMNFERVNGDGPGLRFTSPKNMFPDVWTGAAAFGATPNASNFSGQIVPAVDANGAITACVPIDNSVNDVTGKIALVSRGACTFATKALNAQAAGAKAVLIHNNAAGNLLPGGSCADCTIPVLGARLVDGNRIREFITPTLPLFSAPQPNLLVFVNYVENATFADWLGCADDNYSFNGNPYLSRIQGCVPPGDYVVSVRGWSTSAGPYTLNIVGQEGCTPTEPPTMLDDNTLSSYCLPNSLFERRCL